MSWLVSIYEVLKPLFPAAVAVAAVVAALVATRKLLARRFAAEAGRQLLVQVVMLGLTFVGFLAVIMALPINDSARGQLLSLIGVVLSAAIALSSTTLLGNAMAGIMLRATRSFRMGDYLSVGDQFGRVSERGLFHVEIQTQDRDLTTLPNLYLVTQPVRVIRASGTIVSAEVSLGYDVPRGEIEQALLAAAGEAGLEEPFVHITGLGDFSVVYRVAGLLTEVKELISRRSRLKQAVLDALHAAGIEIVSPNFMNTRAVPEGKVFVPPAEARAPAAPEDDGKAEDLAFDKAEEAEKIDDLGDVHERLGAEIEAAEERLAAAEGDARAALEAEVEELKSKRDGLAEEIEKAHDSQAGEG